MCVVSTQNGAGRCLEWLEMCHCHGKNWTWPFKNSWYTLRAISTGKISVCTIRTVCTRKISVHATDGMQEKKSLYMLCVFMYEGTRTRRKYSKSYTKNGTIQIRNVFTRQKVRIKKIVRVTHILYTVVCDTKTFPIIHGAADDTNSRRRSRNIRIVPVLFRWAFTSTSEQQGRCNQR